MLLRHQHLASGRSLWSLMRYGGRTKTFRRIRNCSRLEQALFYSPKPGEAPATAERFSSTASSQNETLFLVGDSGDLRCQVAPILCRYAAPENHNVADEVPQLICNEVEVVFALGQNDRRPAFLDRSQDVIQDESVARLIVRQRAVEVLDP